ncbi:unnamed protein product [Somion occarium]|uniref:Manganese/iron superoxide dismutase C-terminal domain-containing protein n=1 Tax=Somion occarium TaxID=3059160 RepID=A0ABP1D2H0_9APHY
MNRLGLQIAASTRAARRSAPRSLVWSRCLHSRKELSYPIEGGLGDFLPPAALKMIAVDYQQGLLDRLNDEVKNTEQENKSVVQTVIDTAVDPNKVLAFSYASEALNNSFFLECMKPPPVDDISRERSIGHELGTQIRTSFSSLEQLKSNVGATALGMFSSGWIWLACDQSGHLAVIPTFGAGTLLVRSQHLQLEHYRTVVGEDLTPPSQRQKSPEELPESTPAPHHTPSPPPAPTSPASGTSHPLPPLHPHTPSRTFSTTISTSLDVTPNSIHYSRSAAPSSITGQKDKDPSKIGYGVWGKEEYVKRFWSVVDWVAVSDAFVKFTRRSRGA